MSNREVFNLFREDLYYQHITQIYDRNDTCALLTWRYLDNGGTEFKCERMLPMSHVLPGATFQVLIREIYRIKLDFGRSIAAVANCFLGGLQIVYVDVRDSFMGIVVSESPRV